MGRSNSSGHRDSGDHASYELGTESTHEAVPQVRCDEDCEPESHARRDYARLTSYSIASRVKAHKDTRFSRTNTRAFLLHSFHCEYCSCRGVDQVLHRFGSHNPLRSGTLLTSVSGAMDCICPLSWSEGPFL